jgi:Tol biopolymer transport system component
VIRRAASGPWAFLAATAVLATVAGATVREAKPAANRETPPGRIAVSADGDLYVTNPKRSRLGRPVAAIVMGAPAWSPDGSELAYVGDGALRALSIASGRERLIMSLDGKFSPGPQWSPRGDRLALMLDSPAGASTQLVVVGREGAHRHVVERSACPFQIPQWSPDGRRIAYLRAFGDTSDFAVEAVRPDGSGHGLVWRGALDQPDALAWSPDGKRIAFVGTAVGRSSSPAIVVASANENKALTAFDLGFAPDNASVGNVRWSPTGRLVAFSIWVPNAQGRTGYSELVTAAVSGDGDRVLVRTSFIEALAWSPDGQWLAYVAENPRVPSGAPMSLWVIRSDGFGPRRIGLLHEQAGDAALAWRPGPRGGTRR